MGKTDDPLPSACLLSHVKIPWELPHPGNGTQGTPRVINWGGGGVFPLNSYQCELLGLAQLGCHLKEY